MDYKVVYSKRKTVSLKVTHEGLVVHAPFGVGRDALDGIVEKHAAWVEKTKERVKKEHSFWDSVGEDGIEELRALAREVLTKKTERYSNIMGLKYGRITITSAKTRFGSCSSRGDISYSYRLMAYPDRAVDYVVVHELCHLVHMNHSKDFYALLERILPDYKERRALLKQK
ncbi:MAG: M48 family metallopeptidase [Clostridia bacterium]|nr:M48 family metallopeptidase [Clostridia bacterium]